MKFFKWLVWVFFSFTGTVYAGAITVPNHSFETGDTTGWNVTSGGIVLRQTVRNNTDIFSTSPLPSPADGNFSTFSELDALGGTDSNNDPTFSVFTTASSLGGVLNNYQYTLTVAAANRPGPDGDNFQSPDFYTIEILLNGVAAATTTFDGDNLGGGGIPDGAFLDLTTSFTAGPSDAGKAITLALTHTAKDSSNAVSGFYDNVRLDAVLIPEPSSLALVFITIFGAIVVGKRQSRMS